MEVIIKRTTTKEVTEYTTECVDCGKKIVGSSDGQVLYNLKVHKKYNGCKLEPDTVTTEKEVQQDGGQQRRDSPGIHRPIGSDEQPRRERITTTKEYPTGIRQ